MRVPTGTGAGVEIKENATLLKYALREPLEFHRNTLIGNT